MALAAQIEQIATLLRQAECDVTRSTANVEDPGPGPQPGQGNQAALPEPVEPETLNIIQQIVTCGDRSKEIPDPRSPVLTPDIKWVGHVPRAADRHDGSRSRLRSYHINPRCSTRNR